MRSARSVSPSAANDSDCSCRQGPTKRTLPIVMKPLSAASEALRETSKRRFAYATRASAARVGTNPRCHATDGAQFIVASARDIQVSGIGSGTSQLNEKPTKKITERNFTGKLKQGVRQFDRLARPRCDTPVIWPK